VADARPSLLQRLLRWAAIGAVATAVLVWPLSWYLASTAMTVYLYLPGDPATLETNRWEFENEGKENPTVNDIIAIYGTPSDPRGDGTSETIIFPDESRVFHPQERPELALYDNESGSKTWQIETVRYFTPLVSVGAAAAAFLLVLALHVLRKRAAKAAAAP
jgi:hypothetical protein